MTRLHFSSCVVVAVLAMAWVSQASAQVVQSPPGSIGGLFGGRRPQNPNQTSSRWSSTFNLSGGQDAEPVETGGEAPDGPPPQGAAGTAAMNMQYWRGRSERLIEVNLGGFVNRQELASGQLRGATGNLRGLMDVSGRLVLSGMASVSYQPLVLGVIAPLPQSTDTSVPEGLSPPQGVPEQLWISTIATGGATRNWTPRQRMEASYTNFRSRPVDGAGFESASHSASIREVWNATDRIELRSAYAFSQNQQTDQVLGPMPLNRVHSADAGFQIERRLTPRRTLSFTLDGGVDYTTMVDANGVARTSTLPSGSVSLQFNLTSSWTMSAGAGREVTVLNGVTAEPFRTDQVTFQVGGTMGRRANLSIFGAFSRGSTVADQPGSFRAGTGTAQFQYGLGSRCGLFASYSYYDHRLVSMTETLASFPGNYGRHAARAGITLWLPLYGTF